jgi:hypothetical protein
MVEPLTDSELGCARIACGALSGAHHLMVQPNRGRLIGHPRSDLYICDSSSRYEWYHICPESQSLDGRPLRPRTVKR